MAKIRFSGESRRFDVFLSEVLNVSRKCASDMIEGGVALVNEKRKKSSYKLKDKDEIIYDENYTPDDKKPLEAQDIKLDIRYEDEHLLVINKPKNMLTHPSAYERSGTLVNALIYHCKDNLSNADEPLRRGIVHRLDKNTSGLMLAAKTDKAHKNLSEQIRNKTAIRKYLAIAIGDFQEDEGIIDKPLVHYMTDTVKMNIAPDGEGKEAITHYKVIKRFGIVTLVELELRTGRTHQIRAHLSSIGHPILGDTLYGAKGMTPERLRGIKTQEQVLMSYYLSFTHPLNNEIMTFELKRSEWDRDLIKVLNVLGDKE